jgi:hypothetical protein
MRSTRTDIYESRNTKMIDDALALDIPDWILDSALISTMNPVDLKSLHP